MRAVTTATAAAVLGVSPKVLDNILRRIDHEALPPGKQGLERRIPVPTLVDLLLTVELADRLAIPTKRALAVARSLLAGEVDVGTFVQLRIDRSRLWDEVDSRLESAIESVARPARGRPRRRPRRGP